MDKDLYYRYGTNRENWDYKQPPRLSNDVVELMKRERVDDRYRFLWMGIATLRSAEDDINPIVLGPRPESRQACCFVPMQVGFRQAGSVITGEQGLVVPKIVQWLQPKEMFVRIKKAKFWYWTDEEGKIHQAPRPDDLVTPANTVVHRFDVILELGHLVWELQFKLTGDQLVAGHFYKPADAPKEYWHTIKTFRSPTHGYLEPNVLDVEEMIIKREWENRHLSAAEMREKIKANAIAEQQRRQEAADAAEAAGKAEFDAQAEDIINFSMTKAPNAGGMARVT